MATSAAADQIVEVVTPAAGESVSEGTILEWHAKVGDFIKASDTIVEISTDKVDLELPAPASGVVSEILSEEGATVTVGQVIARISLNGGGAPASDANGGGAAPEAAAPAAEAPPAPAAEAPSAPAPDAETPPPSASAAPEATAGPAGVPGAATAPAQEARGADSARVSPVAARAAAAEGVDVSRLS